MEKKQKIEEEQQYDSTVQVMSGISNMWGLDVFTANSVIRDQRVLTCTTFRWLHP